MRRSRDAEGELTLPPGFRFHPTDEELVVHYLCRKAARQRLPVPIIAEVDLYKFDPWDLPEMALFGQREWYFFTPTNRKYPNGLRPSRAAGQGYWKATGADKPVVPKGSSRPVGIKKALVFYQGKAPGGVKTDWIMHEYRLADTNRAPNKKGTLRLDDWVLCRLYNKKISRENMLKQQRKKTSFMEMTNSSEVNEDSGSNSHHTPESEIDNNLFLELDDLGKASFLPPVKEENDWFMNVNLDEFQRSLAGFESIAPVDIATQDCFFSSLESPPARSRHTGFPPI